MGLGSGSYSTTWRSGDCFCTHTTVGPEKFQSVQRGEPRSQELSRRSSLAKLPLSPYNGQSATDTRQARRSARPPARSAVGGCSPRAHPARPPPEPPSPTRAPRCPPAPAARQLAAGAGGHRPSAGSAPPRRGARGARVTRAAQRLATPREQQSPGCVRLSPPTR